MKNLVLLLCLMVMTISSSAKTPINKMNVGGKFVGTHDVTYELFIMQPDSSWELISSQTGRHCFNVEVSSGATYLVRFTTEKADSTVVKYLLINPTKSDNYIVDVDFSTDRSAEVYWHAGAGCYNTRPYEPGTIKLPAHVVKN